MNDAKGGVKEAVDTFAQLGISATNADGSPLFAEDFLQMLGQSELRLDVDAVPEGTVVFAHEPLVRVEGPLWQAQLVETALLTVVNFQTLVATKASRVCSVARGPSGKPEPVLEFGLRRAQGIDGGLAASRAAYVGGCAGTSNVLAGLRFGIPVRGSRVLFIIDSSGSMQAPIHGRNPSSDAASSPRIVAELG